jgi:hypothetical protein
VGRLPRYFKIKDLNEAAVKFFGAGGLEKKRAARAKRQANADKKRKERHVKQMLAESKGKREKKREREPELDEEKEEEQNEHDHLATLDRRLRALSAEQLRLIILAKEEDSDGAMVALARLTRSRLLAKHPETKALVAEEADKSKHEAEAAVEAQHARNLTLDGQYFVTEPGRPPLYLEFAFDEETNRLHGFAGVDDFEGRLSFKAGCDAYSCPLLLEGTLLTRHREERMPVECAIDVRATTRSTSSFPTLTRRAAAPSRSEASQSTFDQNGPKNIL